MSTESETPTRRAGFQRSRFRLNWAAITTVIVALVVGVVIGMGIQFQIDHDAPPAESSAIPACATEDSWGCRWDADEQGNGTGRSFTVDRYGVVMYDDGEVYVPPCTDEVAERGGICEGPLQ